MGESENDDANDRADESSFDLLKKIPKISPDRWKILEEESDPSFKFFFVADRLRDLNLVAPFESLQNLSETLTHREMKTLHVVAFLTKDAPNGVALKDLAAAIQVSLPTASVLIDGLVKKGVLTRTTNPTNRRSALVKLSESGEKCYRSTSERSRRIFRELLSGASEKEARIFEKTLDRFYRRLIR